MLGSFRPLAVLGAIAVAILLAQHVFAQSASPQRLPITPTGPAPEAGHYTTDDGDFLIDHADGLVRLRFSDSDEIFYLSSEPATLGGRVLKYDTGEVALAVNGWGGVTLYTRNTRGGVPAERIREAAELAPRPVSARETMTFAAALSQRLADRQRLAVGFATNWEALSREDTLRALATDAMRNAAYALEYLAGMAPGYALAARINAVRIVAGNAVDASIQNVPCTTEGRDPDRICGEILVVTFASHGGPSARPSSRAIAQAFQGEP